MQSHFTEITLIADMVDILRKEVPYGFDETVKKVEEAMLSEGFGVQLTTGIHEMFKKKLGIDDYPKYTMVLGCKPQLAKRALETSLDMGLIFPCSFTIYEEDRKVKVAHVSIMKIGAEIGLADREAMAPLIEDTGKQVRKVWDKI
jgi:uncharacterized protein (DUF302 family)